MLLLLYHNSDKMQLFFCKDSVNHNLAIHDFNKKDKLCRFVNDVLQKSENFAVG